jgi:hypothetical protein
MSHTWLVVAALTGCYNPELGPCEVTCGAASPCPADLVCRSDDYCHTPDDTSTCTAQTVTLVVSTEGNSGRISSSPTGISCVGSGSAGCMASFAVGTAIMLDAHPFGDQFVGWSGDECATDTTATCMFTIEMATTVNGTFQ